MALKLFNTLGREEIEVRPQDGKTVRFYACGPTVYSSPHIGNYRTYLFEDILRRTLEYTGVPVRHVMNITDVGHLVGDGDDGEDKLDVASRKEKKDPKAIAAFYEAEFKSDLLKLHILTPHTFLRATEAIPESQEIITLLLEKGFAYTTELAIYFDVSKLSGYGKLTGQRLEEKQTAARDEVVEDSDKRNPRDFALWFFLKGRYAHHLLHWPSPWGEGFPGWHIECSAISRKLLGQPLDIHAGGVDHIGTHHTNEIAQSEAAYNEPLASIWIHGEFLETKEKMSKSLGNVVTIRELESRKINPLAFRYLTFLTHYRQKLNFSWEALEQAENAFNKLVRFTYGLGESAGGAISSSWKQRFIAALENDLNMPEALALMWQMTKDPELSPADKRATLLDFDRVLGLGLEESGDSFKISLDGTLQKLLLDREEARAKRDFAAADSIRHHLAELGYDVSDTANGPILKKLI